MDLTHALSHQNRPPTYYDYPRKATKINILEMYQYTCWINHLATETKPTQLILPSPVEVIDEDSLSLPAWRGLFAAHLGGRS